MQVLLLDLDDVAVLSEALVCEVICSFINATIQQRGVNHQYTLYELKERFVGIGFTRIMCELGLQHNFEITESELKQMDEESLNLILEIFEAKVEATPGAIEMVAQMYESGIICAIVSSSEMKRIEVCLRKTGLDHYIPRENMFSAADSLLTPEPKPSPAIYNHAVKVLGVAPEQCLAVEDSVTGVRAAVQANVEVVGYVGAEQSPDKQAKRSKELLEAGATAVFSDWASFLAWVRPRVRCK